MKFILIVFLVTFFNLSSCQFLRQLALNPLQYSYDGSGYVEPNPNFRKFRSANRAWWSPLGSADSQHDAGNTFVSEKGSRNRAGFNWHHRGISGTAFRAFI